MLSTQKVIEKNMVFMKDQTVFKKKSRELSAIDISNYSGRIVKFQKFERNYFLLSV